MRFKIKTVLFEENGKYGNFVMKGKGREKTQKNTNCLLRRNFFFLFESTHVFFLCTAKIAFFLMKKTILLLLPYFNRCNIHSNQFSFDNQLQRVIDYLDLALRAAHVITDVNSFTNANKKCILLWQSSVYHTCKCPFMYKFLRAV